MTRLLNWFKAKFFKKKEVVVKSSYIPFWHEPDKPYPPIKRHVGAAYNNFARSRVATREKDQDDDVFPLATAAIVATEIFSGSSGGESSSSSGSSSFSDGGGNFGGGGASGSWDSSPPSSSDSSS